MGFTDRIRRGLHRIEAWCDAKLEADGWVRMSDQPVRLTADDHPAPEAPAPAGAIDLRNAQPITWDCGHVTQPEDVLRLPTIAIAALDRLMANLPPGAPLHADVKRVFDSLRPKLVEQETQAYLHGWYVPSKATADESQVLLAAMSAAYLAWHNDPELTADAHVAVLSAIGI